MTENCWACLGTGYNVNCKFKICDLCEGSGQLKIFVNNKNPNKPSLWYGKLLGWIPMEVLK